MASYKEMTPNSDGWATVEFEEDVINNFKAIVGGKNLVLSIQDIDNSLLNIRSDISNLNNIVNDYKALVDSNILKINELISELNLKYDRFKNELEFKINDEALKIWNNTGNINFLYSYFNDPDTGKRRNIVISVNKLLDDLGYVQNLTTQHKTTAVGAINELDAELGDLEALSSINILNNNTTIVECLNYINDVLIGDIQSDYTPINTLLKGVTLVKTLFNIDALLGLIADVPLEGDTIAEKLIDLFNKMNDKFDEIFELIGDIELIPDGYKEYSIVKIIISVITSLGIAEADIQTLFSNVTDMEDRIKSLETIVGGLSVSGQPIGVTYTQYDIGDGTFSDDESPESLFGGVWELMFADESVFFRTEGTLSEDNRVDGVQQDAMQLISGTLDVGILPTNHTYKTSGSLKSSGNGTWGWSISNGQNVNNKEASISLDSSRQTRTASETRTVNRLVRIWKRIV